MRAIAHFVAVLRHPDAARTRRIDEDAVPGRVRLQGSENHPFVPPGNLGNPEISLDLQLDPLRILPTAQPVRTLEKHLRVLVDGQLPRRPDAQVSVHQHPVQPVHRLVDGSGPARLFHLHSHGLPLPVQAQLHAGRGRRRQPLRIGGGIGPQVEGGEAPAVEGIRGIPQIARVILGVRPPVGPEIQIVQPALRIRHLSRGIAGILKEPVGADQVQLFLVLFGVAPELGAHMPDQQAFARDVAVVERAPAGALLQQQVLLVERDLVHRSDPQGDLEDRTARVHILHHHSRGILVHLDQTPVVRADPAQALKGPGRECRGPVVAGPAVGPPAHQAPPADPGAVVHRSLVPQVVEVGQGPPVGEFVRHDAHGLGKGPLLLNGPPGSPTVDGDGLPVAADILGLVRVRESQVGDAGGPVQQKPPRHGQHIDKDIVHDAVIVPGVGNAVRTIVVEKAEIDILVHLLEDLQDELPELAQLTIALGQIGRGLVLRNIAPRHHRALDLQLAGGHGVVEVGETAGQVCIEEGGGIARGLLDMGGLILELGEDDQDADAAPGRRRLIRQSAGNFRRRAGGGGRGREAGADELLGR